MSNEDVPTWEMYLGYTEGNIKVYFSRVGKTCESHVCNFGLFSAHFLICHSSALVLGFSCPVLSCSFKNRIQMRKTA